MILRKNVMAKIYRIQDGTIQAAMEAMLKYLEDLIAEKVEFLDDPVDIIELTEVIEEESEEGDCQT